MKKKLVTTFLVACLTMTLLVVPNNKTFGVGSDEVLINLADSGVKVNNKKATTDKKEAVYVGEKIIYYEEGQDSSYGEGGLEDEHTSTEANNHTVVTIAKPGTYRIEGALSAGQIAVDLGAEAKTDPDAVVEIILDGVNITNTVAPGIIFYNVWESDSSEKAGAIVTIEDDTVNTVSGSYVARIYKEGTTKKLHKYDGAFYSKMSLMIQGKTKGNGKLTIEAENEGLCSDLHLTINGGDISVNANEDGINASEDGLSKITINGGNLYVNAGKDKEGDGIDSNGFLIINGGTIISLANGKSGDGGIDADEGIIINGGTVIALGSRNDDISADSKQSVMELSYAAMQGQNKRIHITDTEGNTVLDFTPEKEYQSFTFSSPELKLDKVYNVYSGDVKQQYTGHFTSSRGMMGQDMWEAPEELDQWLASAEIPDEIRTWINSMKEMSSRGGQREKETNGKQPMEPNGQIPKDSDVKEDKSPEMRPMPNDKGSDMNVEPSTEFKISKDIYSFANVIDDINN